MIVALVRIGADVAMVFGVVIGVLGVTALVTGRRRRKDND